MVFQPKRAIIYEWLHDKFPARTITEKISMFKELNVDTIFRSFWYCPEAHCAKNDTSVHYYTDIEWAEMQKIIFEIHTAISGIKLIGCLGPRINIYNMKNYKTGTVYNSTECQNMYLDPRKWGINVTKEEVRANLGDLSTSDFTNDTYYQIILSRSKKYIDIGCDAIWLDELYKSTYYLHGLTKDKNHSAVKEVYNAATNLIKEIRDYFTLQGKEPIIGSWLPPNVDGVAWFSNNIPKLDFVTVNRGSTAKDAGYEMVKPLDYPGYKTQVNHHRNWYGRDVKSIFFIDDPQFLSVFAQCLDKELQKKKIIEITKACTNSGMVFAYPIHGQWMMDKNTVNKFCKPPNLKKSYGLYNYYDAKAPEFQTYDTIKTLIK